MTEMATTNAGANILTPVAAQKASKATPTSIDTKVETPVGSSPDILHVVKLPESPLSVASGLEDKENSPPNEVPVKAEPQVAASPSKENVTPRKMLLSQMADAIPSPESVVATPKAGAELKQSPAATPVSKATPETEKADTPSSGFSLKPSKLSFNDSRSEGLSETPSSRAGSVQDNGRERPLVASDSSPVVAVKAAEPLKKAAKSPKTKASPSADELLPYPMAAVTSWASIPFDCVDDVKQGVTPSPTNDGPYDEEPLVQVESSHSEAIVRTLFGWVETKGTNPIKAKILSDRDVRLPVRRDYVDDDEEESVEDAELGKAQAVPTELDALTGPEEYEDEPPHIKAVQANIAEVLRKKRERRTRSWPSCGTLLYYGSIMVVVAVIVTIAIMLLLGNRPEQDQLVAAVGPENATATPQEDTPTGDILEDSNGNFPNGFFSVQNEFCTSATPLEEGVAFSGSTKNHFFDRTLDTCGDSMSVGRAAWFIFEAQESKLMAASTCEGTGFDTQITVATGDNCEEISCVTFDDQACGEQSRATWYAEAGKTYFINVHGFRDAQGDFQLLLEEVKSHDDCIVSQGPVAIGTTVFGTTAGATVDANVTTCGDVSLFGRPGVWYTIEETVGIVQAKVFPRGLGFVPQVSVYSGSDCDELICETGSSLGSTTWEARRGETYYVLVNSLTGLDGDFDLSIGREQQDTCEFAIPLFPGGPSFEASTSLASWHDVPICGDVGSHSAPGMWFSVVGNGNLLAATTCGPSSTLDSHISVFRNGCSELQCLGATGQDLPCGANGAVTWVSEIGVEYLLYVSGRGSRVGDFSLRVVDAVSDVGETCESAIAMGSENTVIYGSNTNSPQTSLACGDVVSSRGVWYEFEGTGRTMSLWACDPATDFDARLSVFSGSCNFLECEDFMTTSCDRLAGASLQINTVAGFKYFLLVHGPSADDIGSYAVNVQEDTSNDSCARAFPITAEANSYYGSTFNSDAVAVTSCDGTLEASPTKSSWYTITGTGDVFYFNTCSDSTDFSTQITVFQGSCGTPVCTSVEEEACGSQSIVAFETQEDEKYYVRVTGSAPEDFGNFVLTTSARDSFFGW